MTPSNIREIKVSLSIGLFAAIASHAIMTATAQRVAPHIEQAIFQEVTPVAPTGGINFDAVRGAAPVNSLPVNAAARDEVKGSPQTCTTCPQAVTPVRDQSAPSVTRAPTRTPAAPATIAAASKPVKPRYSIMFFVRHNEPQSQGLLNWVNSDPMLQKWKTSTNFHTYAPGNELYKSRYAKTVPESYFPAVLVSAPDGGHVYFAAQANLPSSPQELVKGITESVQRHKQIMAQDPLPKQAVEPNTFQLVSSTSNSVPCDGDQCYPHQLPNQGSTGGLSDLFRRPTPPDPVSGILRSVLAPQASTTAILLVIVGGVLLVLLLKRG